METIQTIIEEIRKLIVSCQLIQQIDFCLLQLGNLAQKMSSILQFESLIIMFVTIVLFWRLRMRQVFMEGNYSKEETMQGKKLFAETRHS